VWVLLRHMFNLGSDEIQKVDSRISLETTYLKMMMTENSKVVIMVVDSGDCRLEY
jgi:hypothetical protein